MDVPFESMMITPVGGPRSEQFKMHSSLQNNPSTNSVRALPPSKREGLIIDAAKNCQVQLVKMLLESGVSVNACDSERKTPLHHAIEATWEKNPPPNLIELLLIHGADVNFVSCNGETPLFYAVDLLGHDLKLFRRIVSYSKDINFASSPHVGELQGYTPLHYAVSRNNRLIVDWLLENGTDVNIAAKDGETALHIATKACDTGSFDKYYNFRIADALIEGGANIHAVYTSGKFEGYTPLHTTAMQYGFRINPNFLKNLLDHGADPNATARDKQTPLHLAVLNSREEHVAKILLGRGANPNALNADSKTPFCIALEKHNAETVKEFLKHCPNLNNEHHSDVLRLALEDESFANAVIPQLVKYGFPVVNYLDDGDFFYQVVAQRWDDLVLKLLSQGFNPNKLYRLKNGGSFIPVHLAVSNYFLAAIPHFIAFGADINARDEAGRTALSCVSVKSVNDMRFYSARGCAQDGEDNRYYSARVCAEMIKLLLGNGACAKDNPELLCFAVRNCFFELFELLLKHDAEVNWKDDLGFTVLHYATTSSFVPLRDQVFKMLVERGADVNAKSKSGLGVLHFAVLNDDDRYYVTRLLLEYNADVNICADGVTPLHLSAMRGNCAFSQLLLRKGADANAKLNNGKTALHVAVSKHICPVSFKAFTERFKGLFNIQMSKKNNVSGASARVFLRVYDARIIDTLIEGGADVNVKDNEGKTALHYAALNGRMGSVLVDFLIKHGADVTSRDDFHRTALHYAKGKDNLTALVVAGADINCKDVAGCTPMHLVAERGIRGMFKYVQLGSDINLENNANVTPIEEGFNTERRFLFSELKKTTPKANMAVNKRQRGFRKEILYLRKHILKLEAAGLYINPQNFQALCDFTDEEFFEECKLEVTSMKARKVGDSAFSYYDIFTCSRNHLVRLSENEKVVQALDSKSVSELFPCYAYEFEMKRVQLKQASTRAYLLELSMEMFRMRIGNLPDLCSELLLDYLSDSDIESLVRASDPHIVIPRNVCQTLKSQLITNLSSDGGEEEEEEEDSDESDDDKSVDEPNGNSSSSFSDYDDVGVDDYYTYDDQAIHDCVEEMLFSSHGIEI